ncbi:MAG: flagellar assembly protein FliX [Alphaproteobacteria bacterium]|nr:flagellar assembly protein FliX [Alphaproteobacteria bacterium]
MRIDGNRRLGAPGARPAGRAGTAGSGFARALSDGEPATRAADIIAPGLVEGLLAFQEVEDATAGLRRRAWQRGATLLDRLEGLKLGILNGDYSSDQLADLAQLARAGRAVTQDPGLDEVLGEIELRAAVEIAKLQREV